MKEERLYKLAYERLFEKWHRAYEELRGYPSCDCFETEEGKLWDELVTLKNEMKIKGFF